MATWSLCEQHAGHETTPVYINIDNVLTIERQADTTTVTMIGGEKVYLATTPERVIKPER